MLESITDQFDYIGTQVAVFHGSRHRILKTIIAGSTFMATNDFTTLIYTHVNNDNRYVETLANCYNHLFQFLVVVHIYDDLCSGSGHEQHEKY